MSAELFEQVRNLSLEIRSLIRQGVREGVEERIQQRNGLLQQWFSQINELINLTNEQQLFLEQLLQEEQQLLTDLQLEQKAISRRQSGQRKASQYLQH
ncbi:MAG: hypothetical protein LRY66_06175 [Saccharospirillaceae bacterium]|nr:hypothetical protein [Saccharospirillaceae bacterium]MCD8530942.1 hypothetical protein [Saccharospirillaceae bacterium]